MRNILWRDLRFNFSILNKHLHECQNRTKQFSKLERNTRKRYRDLPILVQWRQLHFSMRLRTCARTHDSDSASRNLQYYFTWDACSVIYAVRYTIPYNWQDDRWIWCRDLIEITASIRSFFFLLSFFSFFCFSSRFLPLRFSRKPFEKRPRLFFVNRRDGVAVSVHSFIGSTRVL